MRWRPIVLWTWLPLQNFNTVNSWFSWGNWTSMRMLMPLSLNRVYICVENCIEVRSSAARLPANILEPEQKIQCLRLDTWIVNYCVQEVAGRHETRLRWRQTAGDQGLGGLARPHPQFSKYSIQSNSITYNSVLKNVTFLSKFVSWNKENWPKTLKIGLKFQNFLKNFDMHLELIHWFGKLNCFLEFLQ